MEPTVYISPTPWYKRKLVWVFVLILFLIPTGSYLYASYFRKSPAPPAPPPPTATNALEETDSPIALDILKNPAIYQWTGSVEGTVEAGDNTSITIVTKNNHSITIPIDSSPNGTKFYSNKPGKDSKAQSLTINDMRIGSKVRGDFFIIPGKKNEMRAGSFVIIEP